MFLSGSDSRTFIGNLSPGFYPNFTTLIKKATLYIFFWAGIFLYLVKNTTVFQSERITCWWVFIASRKDKEKSGTETLSQFFIRFCVCRVFRLFLILFWFGFSSLIGCPLIIFVDFIQLEGCEALSWFLSALVFISFSFCKVKLWFTVFVSWFRIHLVFLSLS